MNEVYLKNIDKNLTELANDNRTIITTLTSIESLLVTLNDNLIEISMNHNKQNLINDYEKLYEKIRDKIQLSGDEKQEANKLLERAKAYQVKDASRREFTLADTDIEIIIAILEPQL